VKILKFGGTSVGSPENIKKVIEIVRTSCENDTCIVVVSAFTKVTDRLIAIAQTAAQRNEYTQSLTELEARHFEAVRSLVSVQAQPSQIADMRCLCNELEDVLKGIFLTGELTLRTQDLVLSFGERLSAMCVAAGLTSDGLQANMVDARSFVRTDARFGSANVLHDKTYACMQAGDFFAGSVAVVTGFIGSTEDGHTTTLGRGGSDLTASLLGVALAADCVEIWTDVDGILTADPRIVPDAKCVDRITYEEAMELSYFGAKVIYHPTLLPVRDAHVPILIKNTFNPSAPGTLIGDNGCADHLPIVGISSVCNGAVLRIQGVGLVNVAGTARRVFKALGKESINVILISQASSEYSICLLIDAQARERAQAVLNEEFALEIGRQSVDPVIAEDNSAVIAVIGSQMHHTPGTAGRVFDAVGRAGVNIKAIAQGSSEINISFVVTGEDCDHAIRAVHNEFFGATQQMLHIYLLGAGRIGSTLLEQIRKQAPLLLKNGQCNLRVVGIANSEKMLLDSNGIALDEWETALGERGEKSDAGAFIDAMKNLGLRKSIFVDCTASEDVARAYGSIIDAGIAIVTPNKKANASSYAEYQSLHTKVSQSGVPFLYETNVGAALPVIATLHDLNATGDTVQRIEAILSGTLSYIFNTFSQSDRPFSDIVREAQEKGYTEPDPRDDLSGMDVARKMVILAREIGMPLEIADIAQTAFLSDDCFRAKTVDDFFGVLKTLDVQFAERRALAHANGKVLRFIASIDQNGAALQLQEVDSSHPFYLLSGSDNIVSFTTTRYCDTPLVIKGPGAGVQVTAGGVFADILKTIERNW